MYKGIKTKTTTATTKNNDNSVTTHLVLGPLKTSVHFQRVPNILLQYLFLKIEEEVCGVVHINCNK